MSIKKVRTFMIEPRVWNRFKKLARSKDCTASAHLRNLIQEAIDSAKVPRKNDTPQ